MKRTRNLILLGVVVYVFVLLRQFPADVAVGLFAPDNVKIYSASGTVWDGRAEAIAPPGGITLGATDWRVSGLWLLTGRLKGEFGT
ncbi:MAG: type II secretion system protein N, partial [Pseudomonadota bacterium]